MHFVVRGQNGAIYGEPFKLIFKYIPKKFRDEFNIILPTI